MRMEKRIMIKYKDGDKIKVGYSYFDNQQMGGYETYYIIPINPNPDGQYPIRIIHKDDILGSPTEEEMVALLL